ncbi:MULTISPECIES: GNAT family N-acetyltransferase [Amycolatopsis]|uniref:N-acetyltransferase domain-containing protein n=2 Tax=Amycolatopsis TaxID=1813 RepID=A0A1I3XFH3_9PSEU|nr:GNAT family N-acetyltransferase [Amycolatopsis sacchari]SFK18240.1 hypothetical protein SAMN05421835_11568 [Amycolatopsis sacchari]
MSTTVRRNEDEHRYEITVDGELAGFASYVDRDGQRVVYHTEVFDAFAGHGLGTKIVTEALADIRGEGRRLVPVCPLFAAYLRKHPEQGDIADQVRPETLRWLEERLG